MGPENKIKLQPGVKQDPEMRELRDEIEKLENQILDLERKTKNEPDKEDDIEHDIWAENRDLLEHSRFKHEVKRLDYDIRAAGYEEGSEDRVIKLRKEREYRDACLQLYETRKNNPDNPRGVRALQDKVEEYGSQEKTPPPAGSV
ncbi:hypothetical protein DL764_006177 [Monosporascus ibericus]|uniref:Uncharacterized protein n=1 Tax=Monosporascus ibericus TaxID=155417 RepID=A0A4Q4T8M1_9PEZI|nr:hypothetical protein DL764_006177 [Monosporascus ibericus]